MPRFSTTALKDSTGDGPVVALGFFVREHDLGSPVESRVQFGPSPPYQAPVRALLEMSVGILAGCTTIAQINPTIRSAPLLAVAWGRSQFYEQSTIARVLDACTAEQIGQLRAANEALLPWTGPVYHHDFAHPGLALDIDLTGLLASKHAQGSQKGYFPAQKMQRDDRSLVSLPPRIVTGCSPGYILVRRRVAPRYTQWSTKYNDRPRGCGLTLALATPPTWRG
jgi:hypothetical protein